MTDKDYSRLIELTWVGGGFIPYNQNAESLANQCVKGEIITFIEVTKRDLKFHRCYMSLLAFIYDYMPYKFKQSIPKDKFYQWLKHLKGQYDVVFEFKDGTKMVEYESIAFGKMSDKRFKEYIKEQMPYIYEEVLGAFFTGEMLNSIIESIESEYEKFFANL